MKIDGFLDRYVDYVKVEGEDFYFHWNDMHHILTDLLELAAEKARTKAHLIGGKYEITEKEFNEVMDYRKLRKRESNQEYLDKLCEE